MDSDTINIETIDDALTPYGLVTRGGFNGPDLDAESLVLVGSAGSEFWTAFRSSPEIKDGEEHALDRWSARIGNGVAARMSATSVFPFGEAPFHPFLEWAQRAEPVQSSAMGIFIHPEYGLWHAYRFALLLPLPLTGLRPRTTTKSACVSCVARPCLSSCPVGAFSTDGYDVEACCRYLATEPDARCHTSGCIARQSCPEGSAYRYEQEHAAFHMKAFVRSQGKSFSGND